MNYTQDRSEIVSQRRASARARMNLARRTAHYTSKSLPFCMKGFAFRNFVRARSLRKLELDLLDGMNGPKGAEQFIRRFAMLIRKWRISRGAHRGARYKGLQASATDIADALNIHPDTWSRHVRPFLENFEVNGHVGLITVCPTSTCGAVRCRDGARRNWAEGKPIIYPGDALLELLRLRDRTIKRKARRAERRAARRAESFRSSDSSGVSYETPTDHSARARGRFRVPVRPLERPRRSVSPRKRVDEHLPQRPPRNDCPANLPPSAPAAEAPPKAAATGRSAKASPPAGKSSAGELAHASESANGAPTRSVGGPPDEPEGERDRALRLLREIREGKSPAAIRAELGYEAGALLADPAPIGSAIGSARSGPDRQPQVAGSSSRRAPSSGDGDPRHHAEILAGIVAGLRPREDG